MPGDVVRELLPGEHIRWEGRPAQGVRMRLVDIPLVLFGAIFAIVGGVIAIATFPFGLLIPHLWIGLYFAAGHFFVDAKIRRETEYAITERRAVIVRRWPLHRSTTINLTTVQEIGVQRHRDGTGTITFGSQWNRFARQASFAHHVSAFEFIDNVDEVARLVHSAALN